MKKIAFVFPGQGSQYVGMGKEVADNYSDAKEIFMKADQVLERRLSELCFIGPEESLTDTRNAQPGILTVSVALLQVFKGEGIKPDFVAGHSLGEYSALVAAEVLDFATAIKLVQKRAELMAGSDPERKGGMAAVLGLSRESLNACLAEIQGEEKVEAANFNCPGQIVISGAKSGLVKAQELVTAQGGKFIPLAVSGPFHSSYMKRAADDFQVHLTNIPWREPVVPVIANITARPYLREQIVENLYRQVFGPVLWEDTIAYLAQNGVEVFVEIGPGKVLTGLIKKTIKDALVLNCADLTSLKKALEILKEV